MKRRIVRHRQSSVVSRLSGRAASQTVDHVAWAASTKCPGGNGKDGVGRFPPRPRPRRAGAGLCRRALVAASHAPKEGRRDRVPVPLGPARVGPARRRPELPGEASRRRARAAVDQHHRCRSSRSNTRDLTIWSTSQPMARQPRQRSGSTPGSPARRRPGAVVQGRAKARMRRRFAHRPYLHRSFSRESPGYPQGTIPGRSKDDTASSSRSGRGPRGIVLVAARPAMRRRRDQRKLEHRRDRAVEHHRGAPRSGASTRSWPSSGLSGSVPRPICRKRGEDARAGSRDDELREGDRDATRRPPALTRPSSAQGDFPAGPQTPRGPCRERAPRYSKTASSNRRVPLRSICI